MDVFESSDGWEGGKVGISSSQLPVASYQKET